MLKIIIGILLFATAVAIIYAWGYVKSQRNSQKLQKKFEEKIEKTILEQLKNKNKVKKDKLKTAIKGITVKGSLFSGIRYKVTDPEELVNYTLNKLEKKNIINIKSENSLIKYDLYNKNNL